MKIKNIFLFIYIFFSCESTETNLLELDPSSFKNNTINLSDIADEIEYIPLDNLYQISNLVEIKITDTSILLSSQTKKSWGIYIYNRKGNIINKIEGIQGNGPGECTYCTDFTLDDSADRIYILDSMQKEIEVFSTKNKYIRTISIKEKINDFPIDIAFWNSKLILGFSIANEYNWEVFDTLGNIVNKKKNALFPIKSNIGLFGGFFEYNGEMNFWEPFIDTVFTISSNWKYHASFLFKRSENWVSPIVNNISTYFSLCRIHSIFETKRYIIILFAYQKKLKIAMINKKERTVYLSPEGQISNNYDGGPDFKRIRAYFKNNNSEYIVQAVYPYEIKTHINSLTFINSTPKFPEKKRVFENLASKLNENDNPVLMLVKLKE